MGCTLGAQKQAKAEAKKESQLPQSKGKNEETDSLKKDKKDSKRLSTASKGSNRSSRKSAGEEVVITVTEAEDIQKNDSNEKLCPTEGKPEENKTQSKSDKLDQESGSKEPTEDKIEEKEDNTFKTIAVTEAEGTQKNDNSEIIAPAEGKSDEVEENKTQSENDKTGENEESKEQMEGEVEEKESSTVNETEKKEIGDESLENKALLTETKIAESEENKNKDIEDCPSEQLPEKLVEGSSEIGHGITVEEGTEQQEKSEIKCIVQDKETVNEPVDEKAKQISEIEKENITENEVEDETKKEETNEIPADSEEGVGQKAKFEDKVNDIGTEDNVKDLTQAVVEESEKIADNDKTDVSNISTPIAPTDDEVASESKIEYVDKVLDDVPETEMNISDKHNEQIQKEGLATNEQNTEANNVEQKSEDMKPEIGLSQQAEKSAEKEVTNIDTQNESVESETKVEENKEQEDSSVPAISNLDKESDSSQMHFDDTSESQKDSIEITQIQQKSTDVVSEIQQESTEGFAKDQEVLLKEVVEIQQESTEGASQAQQETTSNAEECKQEQKGIDEPQVEANENAIPVTEAVPKEKEDLVPQQNEDSEKEQPESIVEDQTLSSEEQPQQHSEKDNIDESLPSLPPHEQEEAKAISDNLEDEVKETVDDDSLPPPPQEEIEVDEISENGAGVEMGSIEDLAGRTVADSVTEAFQEMKEKSGVTEEKSVEGETGDDMSLEESVAEHSEQTEKRENVEASEEVDKSPEEVMTVDQDAALPSDSGDQKPIEPETDSLTQDKEGVPECRSISDDEELDDEDENKQLKDDGTNVIGDTEKLGDNGSGVFDSEKLEEDGADLVVNKEKESSEHSEEVSSVSQMSEEVTDVPKNTINVADSDESQAHLDSTHQNGENVEISDSKESVQSAKAQESEPENTDSVEQAQEVSVEQAQGVSVEQAQQVSVEQAAGVNVEQVQGVSVEQGQEVSVEQGQGVSVEQSQQVPSSPASAEQNTFQSQLEFNIQGQNTVVEKETATVVKDEIPMESKQCETKTDDETKETTEKQETVNNGNIETENASTKESAQDEQHKTDTDSSIPAAKPGDKVNMIPDPASTDGGSTIAVASPNCEVSKNTVVKIETDNVKCQESVNESAQQNGCDAGNAQDMVDKCN